MASPTQVSELRVARTGSTHVGDSAARSVEPYITKAPAGKCPYCGATTIMHSEVWDDGWEYAERDCTCGYFEVV